MKTQIAILMLCSACVAAEPKYFDANHFNPDHVDLVYTPDPGMEQVLADSIAILEKATGNEFIVGPNGVPVSGVAIVRTPESNPVCGNTPTGYIADHINSDGSSTVEFVHIHVSLELPASVECWSVSRSLAHEMIHSLRRKLLHPENDIMADHTVNGLFQTYAHNDDYKLNSQSLIKICEAIDCVLFNPED